MSELRDVPRWDRVLEVERRQRLGVDELTNREESFAESLKAQERCDDTAPIIALFR